MKKTPVRRILTGLLSVTILMTWAAPALASYPSAPPSSTTAPSDAAEHHHRHPHHKRGSGILKETAALLGIQQETLIKDWKQGKTLKQIAKEQKGWDEEELLKKLTESHSAKIDAALQSGSITKEQAELAKKSLPERLKKMINYTYQERHQPNKAPHI